MITLPYKTNITKEEVLQNIKDNENKCFSFKLKKNWASANYAALNNELDDVVEGGELLGDVVYLAYSLELQDITFVVVAHDLEDYLAEFE